jgi:parallel beta-helix repeat protein
VELRYKYASGNNLIVGNTARNNIVGFAMQETERQTLIDNIAQDNEVGFDAIDQSLTLLGNVALRNRLGFRIRGSEGPVLGNRAEHNGEGFWIERVGEMTGNVAKQNTGAGFVFDSFASATGLDRVRHNVAHRNGGDGFNLRLSSGAGTLSDHYAIRNFGHGLHVVEVDSGTITGNTAIANHAGDLADDTDCRVVLWVANRFGTAAQPCIH